ncbi:hypothetical protein PG911_12140 [Tenacibaculum ovolyticum]|uniref:hypothetical protein n=1 Tax=Tenacibaculum ovolyticum TaxID=104270 RepID=UPI0022F3CBB0|nr:hypothetical protein [Tenacibaculum ovolyticum]WBX75404.1 hypothetical protein PG911_12140 [Tenacibaculum ovolyticum]
MTPELIVFIAAILFGILVCWRESKGNKLYRFVNKILNSKELQMKASNKKGFVFQQTFLLRLVFIAAFYLMSVIVIQFLIPVTLATISVFIFMIVGTLIGVYVADLIFKSSKIIEEQSDSLENIVNDSIEKGKDFIEDLKGESDTTSSSTESNEALKKVEKPKAQEKSARERLKDKGLL